VEIEAPKQLTTKKMAEAFKLHDAALEMLMEDDPILERSSASRREQENLLRIYKELYQEKKKRAFQIRLDHFFKQEGKTAPQKTPENSPATTPRPQVTAKEPHILPRMERQTVLPLCPSNSSTNIHPTPSLNTHTHTHTLLCYVW
jgi:hypothetical protein